MAGEGKVTAPGEPSRSASPARCRLSVWPGAGPQVRYSRGRGAAGGVGVGGPRPTEGFVEPPWACPRRWTGLAKEVDGARSGAAQRATGWMKGLERGGGVKGAVGGGPGHFLGPAGRAGRAWLLPSTSLGTHPGAAAHCPRAPSPCPRPAAAIAAPLINK